MDDFLNAIDHPIVFVFLLMLALAGASSIAYYFLKSNGLQGAASAIKHP